MTETRKLAAVMFTDIVGYTALMSKDEQKALAVLEKNRTLQKDLTSKHNGEFLKEMGDGTLLCFQSALEAVRCAMEIQKSVKDDPDLNLRIGIHLGDIVFKEGDVFGDGVNVASRIEHLADAGGICISEQIYSLLRNQPEIDTVFLDEKRLKNVDHPVKVYMVKREIVPRKRKHDVSKKEGTEEKSIIVLPFINMSPDPDQEYFSDGLTEEIITDLSHIHNLLVISRNSAMTFKGSGKPTKEIAEKVNVRYVLEGSVRKAGNNLRIIAQLIDASNDSHLWAEKYTGTLDDVFDIQEKVSRSIVETLEFKLSAKEDKNLVEHQIDNYQAYEFYLKSNAEIFKLSEASIRNAIQNLNQALDIIGDNALLYSSMAMAYFQLVNIGVEQENYLMKGMEYAKKALSSDPDHPKAIATFGFLNMLKNPKDPSSVYYIKKALSISSNDTDALKYLAVLYIFFIGKISAAVTICEKLMKLDPFDFLTNVNQKSLNFYAGQFKHALNDWQWLYETYPDNLYMHFWYALILVYNEEIEKAFTIIEKSVKRDPDNLYSKLSQMLKFMCQNDKERAYQLMISDFKETCLRDATYSHHIAGFLARLDEKGSALDWIENAVNRGFINYPLLSEQDPFLENIRGEERFKKLMKRVKKEWENFEV